MIITKGGNMVDNKFGAARRASGMTIGKAAECAGLSAPTYLLREKNPGSFRLRELKGMYDSMSDTAKPILLEAISEFFC